MPFQAAFAFSELKRLCFVPHAGGLDDHFGRCCISDACR
jgi:hypothetical protein